MAVPMSRTRRGGPSDSSGRSHQRGHGHRDRPARERNDQSTFDRKALVRSC